MKEEDLALALLEELRRLVKAIEENNEIRREAAEKINET